MKKLVRKIGGSTVISFSAEEREIIGLNEGDIIDITITHIESVEAENGN